MEETPQGVRGKLFAHSVARALFRRSVTEEIRRSEERIIKKRDHACLREYYQRAENEKHQDDGEQPVALSSRQKLPELPHKGLVRHFHFLSNV